MPEDAHIISLKLKRKLEYKQAYLFDTVRPEKVLSALHLLKRDNPLYADIEINEEWIRSWREDCHNFYDAAFENEDNTSQLPQPQDISSQPKPTSVGITDEEQTSQKKKNTKETTSMYHLIKK